MFKGKKNKNKQEATTGSSTNYSETTTVEKFHNVNVKTIVRRYSENSREVSSSTTTQSAIFGQSTSPSSQISARPTLQRDAAPFLLGTASGPPPSSLTSSRQSFPSSRLSFTTTSPIPYRTAFGRTTFGSYPSRRPPPELNSIGQSDTVQSVTLTKSNPERINDIVPTYEHTCKKRGKVLIINNTKFLDNKNKERFGAKKDSDDLKKLFRILEFDVEHYFDLSFKEMQNKVQKFSQSSFINYDICAVIMMSHGTNKNSSGVPVRGDYTEIVGTDNKRFPVDNIILNFTVKNSHTSLKGKPKIFMFQCCRGENDQIVCTDTAPMKNVIKDYSDFLIAHSTLPGYYSNRDPKKGSWYIQSICEVFGKHYKDCHIEELFKIVDQQLSKIHPNYMQTCTYESRGFKVCYLHKRS